MITRKQPKKSKTVRLSVEATDILGQLAKKYSTSEGQVVEQLLLNYGRKVLKP